jgi:hypothetical protein
MPEGIHAPEKLSLLNPESPWRPVPAPPTHTNAFPCPLEGASDEVTNAIAKMSMEENIVLKEQIGEGPVDRGGLPTGVAPVGAESSITQQSPNPSTQMAKS